MKKRLENLLQRLEGVQLNDYQQLILEQLKMIIESRLIDDHQKEERLIRLAKEINPSLYF